MEYLTNLYLNQPLIILDSSASVGLTSGSLTTYGGASVSRDLYVGGKSVLQGGLTTSSLNITGNLYVGGPVMKIPTGNIASRPVNPTIGSIRYNTEIQQFEGYGPGDAWGSLGGVIDIAQTTKILASATPNITDGNLYFYTVGTERMRVSSTGNVGIGLTSPAYSLDVSGGARFSVGVTAGTAMINTVDVTPNVGDISKERTFALSNGVTPAVPVTGFGFNGEVVRGFHALATVDIIRANGAHLHANYDLRGIQLANSNWQLNSIYMGDNTGVDFTINTSGQILYTSTSIGNYTSSVVKFRANTTNV